MAAASARPTRRRWSWWWSTVALAAGAVMLLLLNDVLSFSYHPTIPPLPSVSPSRSSGGEATRRNHGERDAGPIRRGDDGEADAPSSAAQLTASFVLPFQHPVHRALGSASNAPSSRQALAASLHRQFHGTCNPYHAGKHGTAVVAWPEAFDAVLGPLPPRAASLEAASPASPSHRELQALLEEFSVQPARVDKSHRDVLPYWESGEDHGPFSDDEEREGALPCTREAQAVLARHQGWATKQCKQARFLETKLKEGAFGVGSAITLVAHDLLNAMLLGRVLAVASSGWYVAPKACTSRRGWECFFLAPNRCPPTSAAVTIGSRREAQGSSATVVRKKTFDLQGLSRNDAPTLQKFFGESNKQCVERVRAWTEGGGQSTYVMGTFAKGADPTLTYLLAQATRFLLRRLQPWVNVALRYHLPLVVHSPQEWATAVYVQDRGEKAKFREYYNALGCHTFRPSVFLEIPQLIQQQHHGHRDEADGAPSDVLYVSGNTPRSVFLNVSSVATPLGWTVRSTWAHPSIQPSSKKRSGDASGGGETARWGASAPFSSWLDLFAGVGSGAWVCAIQSNWCRVVNFLRLTSTGTGVRRAPSQCPFIDLGLLMLGNATARQRYCWTNPEWPSKGFSGAQINVQF